VVPGDTDGVQGFIQKLAGRADQGSAVVILHASGAFAYNQERRICGARGKDRAQSPFLPEMTGAAGPDGLRQFFVGMVFHLFPRFLPEFPLPAGGIFLGILPSK
jgi:hypothetical protein